MTFLADVNVSRHVVEGLRSQGLDITRVSEIMAARSPDSEIVSAARRVGAVVLSFDQDFSAILAVSGLVAPSLINLRVTDVDAGRLARAIVAVVRATETDLLAGAIVTLDDAGLHVHRLPVA